MKIKRLIATLLLCFTVSAILPSCSGGIDMSEGKALLEDFFSAVNEGDHELAASYFHPSRETAAEVIDSFLTSLNDMGYVDLEHDIEIVSYTGFYSAFYDSDYGGSGLTLNFIAKSGDISCACSALLISNDEGFGIDNITFDSLIANENNRDETKSGKKKGV